MDGGEDVSAASVVTVAAAVALVMMLLLLVIVLPALVLQPPPILLGQQPTLWPAVLAELLFSSLLLGVWWIEHVGVDSVEEAEIADSSWPLSSGRI